MGGEGCRRIGTRSFEGVMNTAAETSPWATYRRLVRYAYPYKTRLIVGILSGMLYGASHAGILAALKGGLAQVIDIENAPMHMVILTMLAIPLVALVRGVGEIGSKYYIQWVGNRVVMDLRNAVFAHLNRLSLAYFVKSRTGEMISRTTNDTTVLQGAVSNVVEDIAKQPLTIISVLGFILYLDPVLSVISIVVFPVCIFPVLWFGRRVRRYAKASQERVADLVSILQENIMCVRIIKAFGMEPYEMGRFREACSKFFSMRMRVVRATAVVEPLIFFISTFGIGLVLVYVRYVDMPGSEFITFAGALVMLYEPVKRLSRIHLQIEQAAASADRVFEVLDEPVAVQDSAEGTDFNEPVRDIRFENVTFAYGDTPVLQDINLTIPAGTRVALVGGSGGGKTTLISLLPRFFDVTAGRILINGRDIRDVTLTSLRRLYGLVTQDTLLFNDTVAGNISYGSQADRASIEAAARQANAHDFITAMPGGYEEMIGEYGMRLSGGQRQRLAIARAMLRNPPIMLLDEATSALDTESERLVQAALQKLMEGRTVFAVAHRLSTVIHCDLILVIDKGRIVEQGTHAELVERGGVYRRLYDMQFSE